jgi:lysozyme
MITEIKDFIIKHEGLKLKPYYCPAGKLSIGVGRNIEDNGISEDEAMYMLNNDIFRCIEELETIFDDFSELPENIQIALIDMIFNLGKTRFLKFKKMIQAIKDKDFKKASEEAKNSHWCGQVGKRCDDVVEMMRG